MIERPMCGIAGILGKLDDAQRAALTRMAQALAHRGPDGEGRWESAPDAEGRGCLLAHRRLSILDLSSAASQPMRDAAARATIVFNGEIYGFAELKSELERAGERFTSSGDTEVLLRWIVKKGVAELGRARGMFAFGLWSDERRQLLLARDPLGIKPLYVARNPDPNGSWSLLFASEVRAILASGLLGRPRLDPVAAASVVWNGYVVSPHTIVQGIESILPGDVLGFDARGRELTRTRCEPPRGPDAPLSDPDLAAALRESVRAHLVSDVPLGVFLSGGIDSSVVANLAQREAGTQVRTFTLSFSERELDEAPFAKRIADAIGTRHTEVRLEEARFVNDLERAIAALDQPSFDGINSFTMSEAVRAAGLTVALVGTGGDELFGGYASFRQIPRLLRLSAATGFVPRTWKGAAARGALTMLGKTRGGAVPPQTRWAKLPAMLAAGGDTVRLYQLCYALFLPELQRELLAPATRASAAPDGLPDAFRARVASEIAGLGPLEAISVLEQRLFLGERLLRDSDAASMAVGLEMRLPLVDARLAAAVRRMPRASRYEPIGRKDALRRAGLTGLDPELFERKKSGFVLPYERWIQGALGKAMDATMRDPALAARAGLAGETVTRLWKAFSERAPGLYWSRAWAIYVLLRWCERHGVAA